MQVNIDLLDLRTLDKAIKQIEQYQKRVSSLTETFFRHCAERIVQIANEKLNGIGLDFGIVAEIKNGWQPLKRTGKNTFVLENTSDRSVYIEFGVGQVGETDPHPEAGKTGYQYNKPSKFKKWDFREGKTVWWFKADSGGIDIIDDDKYRLDSMRTDKGTIIKTAGQPATMFVFNAIQDFIDNKMYVDIGKQLFRDL